MTSPFTDFELMRDLQQDGGKIVLLVMDGLGGLPASLGGKTELELAHTPNLDGLAVSGSLGLSVPIRPGIEPGSGPAHLSLFGYDPVRYMIGRGVLEALGIGFPLQASDVAARGNFASVDGDGLITDRRAGRIPTEECVRLTAKLREASAGLFGDCEVFVEPVQEHRFVFVLRGEGLGGSLTDTDPLAVGKRPLPVQDESGSDEGARTAELVNHWAAHARSVRRRAAGEHLNFGLAQDRGCRSSQISSGCGRGRSRSIRCIGGSPAWWGWRRSGSMGNARGMRSTRWSARGTSSTFSSFTSRRRTATVKTATSMPRCTRLRRLTLRFRVFWSWGRVR